MSVLNAISFSRVPAAAFVLLGLYWGGFAALVPQIKARIGAGDAQFGLLLLGSAAGLVAAMWLAPRADRLLGAWAMPAASLALAAAFAAPALVTGPAGFFLAMVGVGAASGLLDVIMNTRVSELEARHARALMNANHGLFSLAYGLAAVLTGLARQAALPPVTSFAVLAGVTLLLLPRLVMAAEQHADDGTPAGTLPLRVVLLCGLVVLIAFMAEASVESWSALHVERSLGGNAAEGALGPTMLGLTMAAGRFGGQAVAARFREVTVIGWAAALASCGAVLAALAPVPLVAYAGFAVLGLGISVIAPLGLALTGRLAPPRLRAAAIARVSVVAFAGFLVAPVLMGVTSGAFGLRAAFGLVAAICLFVLPLTAMLARRGA